MPVSSPEGSTENKLEIKSILLLDDDIELADTLKVLLEARPYVVTTVKNGVEGLREVMALDFDVIICDMMMPTMPGDMFYLAVQRTKPELCDRFIFVTGHAESPRVSDFLASIDGTLIYKPVEPDQLIRAISLVLKNAESHGASPVN